ncbi:MAG: carboxypeptidase-like regulatory domain-containing protein [Bacteroidota bacterium]
MSRLLQIFLILILSGGAFVTMAQTTVITGRITDQETKQPIPFANIYVEGSSTGGVSDLQGNYSIQTSRTDIKELKFSYTGYKTVTRKIVIGEQQQINVRLAVDATLLQEIEVKSGKVRERYSNRNNPSVDLVREMIAHKEQNRVEHYEYSQYEQYEKLQMSLSNPSNDFKNRRLFRKYKWLFDNVDTTSIEGKALLPIYLQEAITDEYVRRTPNLKKSVTKAKQKVSFDDYVDNSGLSNYLNYLYGDVDLYDNNISIFTIQFLSPLAESAPMFYKFYITDTLKNENPAVVELSFAAAQSNGFSVSRLPVCHHGRQLRGATG